VRHTTIIDAHHRDDGPHSHSHHRSHSMGPTARHHEYVEVGSNHMHVGPIALVAPDAYGHHHHHRDERLIRREIREYSAEAEALRAERRAEKELRRADRIRMAGDARVDEGGLVLYEREYAGPVAEVRRDRKGRMSLVVPSRYR